jgi:hypothetical protein
LLNLDHCTVFCHINVNVNKPRAFTRRVWDYKATDFVSLNDALGNAPFDSAYELFDNVDDMVNYINGLIASVNSDVILNKLVTIRQKDKPWMSNEVRRTIRNRDRCFKKNSKKQGAARINFIML